MQFKTIFTIVIALSLLSAFSSKISRKAKNTDECHLTLRFTNGKAETIRSHNQKTYMAIPDKWTLDYFINLSDTAMQICTWGKQPAGSRDADHPRITYGSIGKADLGQHTTFVGRNEYADRVRIVWFNCGSSPSSSDCKASLPFDYSHLWVANNPYGNKK